LIDVTFRPLLKWPGQLTIERRIAQFRAGFEKTISHLRRELLYLKASSVAIQLAIHESDIRKNDGWPRADARPNHPGVIVSFESKVGPLIYPCDTYREWRDNLRAIALALEALRAVDRYGVTRRAEQYTGWKALPGPLITPPPMTVEEAARFLSEVSHMSPPEVLIVNAGVFQIAYRDAARELHPDNNGGSERPEWHQFQQAAELLKKHHGL
jgi:hypothetical protein